ncbi:MAG: polysaccharide biosynthesis C-terminal domain-containing protein [Deltaproteobacteria bacterium]|nr:polysaccharide biosynthesis C-terminal domain-containing protein [Deltaproteobacteria bacterium]
MHHSRLALIRSIGSQWASVTYGAVVMFFLFFFLARRLGPSSLAILLYIQTIASLFAILQDGGFQVLLFREKVAPSSKIGLTVDALVSGYFGYVSLVTLLGLAAVLISPAAFKTGFLLAFCYFALRCLTNLVSSLLKGQGSFEREALWRFQLNTLLVLPVLFLVEFSTPTPEKVFLGFIIGQLLLFATKNGREVLSRPKLTFPPWRLWKTCLSFIVISGATMIYFKSSIVLLKHLQPDLALVGYYGAAFQILEGVLILATPVVHLAFRHMRLSWLDWETFNDRFGRILIGAVVAAFLITAAGILFAPKVILLAYGKAYGPAADILPLLLLALIFLLPNFILTQGMIALNGERYYALAASLCAIFNVGLNLFLIPRYLAKGAAISTVATEAILTLLLGGWFIRWHRTRTTAQDIFRKSEEEKNG